MAIDITRWSLIFFDIPSLSGRQLSSRHKHVGDTSSYRHTCFEIIMSLWFVLSHRCLGTLILIIWRMWVTFKTSEEASWRRYCNEKTLVFISESGAGLREVDGLARSRDGPRYYHETPLTFLSGFIIPHTTPSAPRKRNITSRNKTTDLSCVDMNA